ncbi:Thioredoxin-like protein Clot [Acorus gramineus]|uniref:Thioredoxin-like protein Clot n=1 Tax=Acorus gramineus TaxID=55184 RepID=A0AAV9AR86_ACOGR|nr:Thioredoxin-like protein Clot [Acorus gramineus]
MPLKMVDANVSNFEEELKRMESENTQNQLKFILFLADKDTSSSLSWCPDCNVAEPVIYQKMAAVPGEVALLRAFVGDRTTWRNPGHPWRADNRFEIRGVPTLVRWENGAIVGRLEDHEAHVEKKINALIAGN